MRRIKYLLMAVVVLAAAVMPIMTAGAVNTDDIVILYENDVHCAVEGYSKLSAMKKELEAEYEHVGVVSVGDYVQGGSLGVVSKGGYIVELMNLVGYDALTVGNHEFDYKLERLNELVGMMNTKPVCCNFQRIGEQDSYFKPYSIVSYGDVDIAFVGIVTPETISSTFPAQFKDEDGNFIYTFNAGTLYDVVQKSIDSAKAEGADYIVALSHIGDEDVADNIETLIKNTSGVDVVLDGHAHSVIENGKLADKDANEVIWTSTGTKFEHIGKLTISDGKITTELIKTDEYENTDPIIDAHIEKINAEYAQLGDRKIAVSEVDLITHDEDGNRLVRLGETNLGDLCAEAFRAFGDADIGYINGGGLRSDIKAGEITFNDILSVFPFNNQAVVARMSGRQIRDFLEATLLGLPQEEGSFPHVSGITFSANMSIPCSVTLDENEQFTGVDGEYRVYDIKVLNRESGKYEPLELDKMYTFASHNYYILECGGGMSMFKDAEILRNDGTLDVEVLEKYIVEDLGGVVGEEYASMSPNITFTDGFTDIEPPQTGESENIALALMLFTLGIIFAAAGMKKRG